MSDLNKFIKEHGIRSISELTTDYRNKTKGRWFDTDTMKFFKTRLSSELFYSPNERLIYFISSERMLSEVRKYSIRSYNVLNGEIETVGNFQGFDTLAQTKRIVKKLVSKAV